MKNLRKHRRDAGLSQHALGAACRIPRWRIAHSEVGIIELKPDEIARIRKVLLEVSQKKSSRVQAALDA
jgi:predicted transcriptional regulator